MPVTVAARLEFVPFTVMPVRFASAASAVTVTTVLSPASVIVAVPNSLSDKLRSKPSAIDTAAPFRFALPFKVRLPVTVAARLEFVPFRVILLRSASAASAVTVTVALFAESVIVKPPILLSDAVRDAPSAIVIVEKF